MKERPLHKLGAVEKATGAQGTRDWLREIITPQNIDKTYIDDPEREIVRARTTHIGGIRDLNPNNRSTKPISKNETNNHQNKKKGLRTLTHITEKCKEHQRAGGTEPGGRDRGDVST